MPIFAGVNSLGQFVIAQTVNTPVGSNVTVQLGGITITFDRVIVAGDTVLHNGPPIIPLPAGYAVFRNLSFDITTTATIASLQGPPIRVGFALDRLSIGPPITPQVFSTLRVFHGENGVFVDRTNVGPPIVPGPPIMPPLIARVSSLSPFVIAQQPPQAVLQSVLDDLRTLRQTTTDKQDGKKLDDAIKHLAKALDPDLWLDPTHLQPDDGERVFNETKDAVGKLLNLIQDKNSSIQDRDSSIHDRDSSIPDATLQGFIDRIVDADRRLAQTAINDAIAAGGNQQHINKATRELSEGDAAAAAGRFKGAIEHYREAWSIAVQSEQETDA